MSIKERARKWWAETIQQGRSVVSSTDIPDQRQRAFLVKEKLLCSVARGYWLLKRPEDPVEEVFPLVYWQVIKAVLGRYDWSVSGLSAAMILSGDQTAQKLLTVSTRQKTNWKLPLTGGFAISIAYDPRFDDRLVKKQKTTDVDIPIDLSEKVFVALHKNKPSEIQSFVAGTDFDLRTLDALYANNPKPIIFQRLVGVAKSAGRLDLAAGLERIIATHTHYQVGRRERIDPEIAARKPAVLKPPWIIRQEQQIQRFEDALGELLAAEVGGLGTYPIDQLIKQAKEHKRYDTYHSTTLEGYRITPEEVDALLSGLMPDDMAADGATFEKIQNRMAIVGYSEAFDFVIAKAKSDFGTPHVSEDLVKDTYHNLFKPSADAGIVDYLTLVSYRNSPAYIRGTLYVPPSHEKLSELMGSFESLINGIKNPVIKTILAHYLFVTIHPYTDGNGRTARLIMNYLLLAAGYPWITIRADQRGPYFEALKTANLNEDIHPFGSFLVQMLKTAQEAGNDR